MSQDPRLGTLVAGCRLTALLGAGAMGAAYLATREADGATVVVKLMAPDLLGDATARRRFEHEARALSRVPPHDNVVHVLGAALEAMPPALVLEHAPGRTLEALLEERGPLPPLEAARVARDVARGLAVIHGLGVVHRDLKPGNVVVGPRGVAKIIDFGVARDALQSGFTAPGQLLGTTLYMAPEVLSAAEDEEERAEADPRADLWALGAVLYHLLAGRPPFDTPDLGELMDLVEEADWAPVPGLPQPVSDVLEQLLEPAPRHRYARAAEVAADLDRALAGQEVERAGLVAADGRRAVFRRGVDRLVVGRDPACGLALDHASVSPRHAQLRRTEGGFELIDLQSAQGTFVDEQRVAAPRAPRDGARVRVGEVALRFVDPRGRAPGGGRLVATRGGRRLVERALGEADLTLRLGRDERCDVRLDSPQVSRLHVTLTREGAGWRFRNESQHGTLLDGRLAPEGVLAPGARLTVGDVEVTLE